MTLTILEPIAVTEQNVSSNIALEDEYVDGQTYTLGQQRRIDGTLYEVVTETTNKSPLGLNRDWADIGPANRYAAFDVQLGADKYRVLETSSKREDLIEFTLTGLSRVGQFSFFGLKATRIEIVASFDGAVIFETGYDLEDATDYNGSIWAWMFVPRNFATESTLTGINIPGNSTITIRILRDGAIAEVASVVMGLPTSYGTTLLGTSRRLRSRATRDFTGLLATLIPRRPTYVVNYNLVLKSNSASAFWQKLESLNGRPAVFSGSDNHPEFTAYGYVESANGKAKSNGVTTGNLELGTI